MSNPPGLRQQLEQRFFRRLNSIVEPLVSSGALSSRLAPASLLVLESTGFRSGQQRRTPLWSLRLGRYRLVGTARGRRSFWVRNLQNAPQTRYFVGGRALEAEAILLTPDYDNLDDWELSAVLRRVIHGLTAYASRGWAFAVLVPAET